LTHHDRKIRDVMTPSPRTVESSTPVQEAAKLMREQDVGAIPIVENGSLVGIVTDRDIAIDVVAQGKDVSTPVGDIGSRDLVTVDPEQSLDEALRLMAQHQVRRLPVVEEDGKPVGIVAQADIARMADDRQTGEVVEQISQ
jgi:CBS domain-containing protein